MTREGRPDREAPPDSSAAVVDVIVEMDGPWPWQVAVASSLAEPGRVVRFKPRPAVDVTGPERRVLRRLMRGLNSLIPDPGALVPESTSDAVADLVIDLRLGARSDQVVAGRYWRFQCGDGRSPIPGLAEVVSGETHVEVALIEHVVEGQRILLTGRLPCSPWSLSRTTELLHAGLGPWPRRALRRTPCLSTVQPVRGRVGDSERPQQAMTYPVLVRAALRSRREWIRTRLRELLLLEQWNVGLVEGTSASLLEGKLPSPVSWLPKPAWGGSLADPFSLPDGTVIAEHIRSADGLGQLVEFSPPIAETRRLVLRKAQGLESEAHRSFPYTIMVGGDVLCIPESWHEGGLHVSRRSSGRWVSHGCALLTGPIVDATLFHHDDMWWLLYSLEDGGQFHELHAAFAPDPFGPFVEHVANPVVVDVTAARCAGPPFVVDGVLYRPAQDCGRTYGGAVTIVAIDVLSTSEYHQRVVARLEPVPPYHQGLHTVSPRPGGLLVDGKRYVVEPRALARKIARRLSPQRSRG